MNNEDGWAAYINKDQIFLKNFEMNIDGEYPDFGCNFETFTNGIFPLTSVVYFVSLAVVFLFLTMRVYEMRRWN